MLIALKTAETEQDFTLLADLARDIWLEHYVEIIGLEQTEYMLRRFQSPEAIAAQVLGGTQYSIGYVDIEPAAYCAFEVHSEDRQIFISKFYVSAPNRRKGIGHCMLQAIEAEGLRQACRSVRLMVNRNNADAIAAYKSMGFQTKREVVTDIGQGFVMDDFEMCRMLSINSIRC